MTLQLRRKNKHDESDFDRLVAQESLILETTEEICRILESEKITRSELAKRLGKSKGFVTQVLSGERNMTLNTMADFAFALKHRLHVRAVPAGQPTYSLTVPVHNLTPASYLGSANRTLDIAMEGWARAFQRHTEARPSEMVEKLEQWSPATEAIEYEEGVSADPLDHEFSLSA